MNPPGAARLRAYRVDLSLLSLLGNRLAWQARSAPDTLPIGIPSVDALAGGLPRGSLTEICGPASSGRTSLLLSILASAQMRQEVCAVVDTCDAFDPASASEAGIDLGRLLWIRCGGDAERALKATDLLVQSGGFGLIVMDLGDTPVRTARRISLASWFRLRRAVEHTSTILLVIEQHAHAGTCASLILETAGEGVSWSGAPGCSQLLRGLRVSVARRKPLRAARATFEARIPE